MTRFEEGLIVRSLTRCAVVLLLSALSLRALDDAAADAEADAAGGEGRWRLDTLFVGGEGGPLRGLQVAADAAGVVYGFERDGDAWVGVWPGVEATRIASTARVGCVALSASRAWVAVVQRDPHQPTATLIVEELGRDGTRHGTWTPTQPALWPDVGSQCALSAGAGGDIALLIRGRAVRGGVGEPLDLWWLSSAAEGKPLGFGPSAPQVLSYRPRGAGVLIKLLAVTAEGEGADKTRRWSPLWFEVAADGALASADPPTWDSQAWIKRADLFPKQEVVYQRLDSVMLYDQATHTLRLLTLTPQED